MDAAAAADAAVVVDDDDDDVVVDATVVAVVADDDDGIDNLPAHLHLQPRHMNCLRLCLTPREQIY